MGSTPRGIDVVIPTGWAQPQADYVRDVDVTVDLSSIGLTTETVTLTFIDPYLGWQVQADTAGPAALTGGGSAPGQRAALMELHDNANTRHTRVYYCDFTG